MAVIDSQKDAAANAVSSANSEANPASKRRSMRVVIDVPVGVFGQNSDGKIFEEKTKTVTVSAHGCLVILKTIIDPQKPALLVNTKTGSEVQCRIAHRKEIEKGVFEIGLDFERPLPRFWGVNFPPEDWNPGDRKKATSPQRPISPITKGLK
jgi:hypothetical protein